MRTQIPAGELTLPHYRQVQYVRCITPACLTVVRYRGDFCNPCLEIQRQTRIALHAQHQQQKARP